MKDFEPFDAYSAQQPQPSQVQGVARYFPPRLSKREHFAGMALQGILSNNPDWSDSEKALEWVSKTSVKYADALIKELNKQIQ